MEVKHKPETGDSFLNTSDGILLINQTDLKVIFLNSAAESLLKSTSDEIVGRSLLTVVPEWRDNVSKRIIAGESPVLNGHKASLTTTKVGATLCDFEHHYIPSTQPPLVLIRFRKTNDHPDPEFKAALALNRETFELALDSANIGLLYLDLGSGTTRWSKGQERLHGLEPGTFDGKLDTWKKSF